MAKGKKDKITGEVSFEGSHHIISSSLAQNFQLYFYAALLKVLGSKMDAKKPATTMFKFECFLILCLYLSDLAIFTMGVF